MGKIATSPSSLDRRDGLAIGGVLLLTVIAFANGLSGDFIHDDQKQIVRNDFIRSPRFWVEALKRDIWAFKGERDEPWSNYWRPGHVAWLIVNYQLFGARPLGWHLTSLLAQLGVVLSAYVFLRWLGASLGIALAIVCIFAIHPTRSESVTWIAGVHDVLATLGQLLALLCLMSVWRREAAAGPHRVIATAWRWLAALVLYAFAVCTKEIAVFFPLIVGLVRFTDPSLEHAGRNDRMLRSVRSAVPFTVVAAVFLALRWSVLRGIQLQFPWQPGFRTVLTSLPLVLCTYLRQLVFPWWLGWSYPIRAVHSPGLWNFLIPLGLLIGLGFGAQRLIRGRVAIVGAALLVLTLLPALNLKAFLPEQIVKDRYLYMPLLGFLMIVVPAIATGIQKLLGNRAVAVQASLTGVIVLLLSIQTVRYNRAWASEFELWQWAVRSDPASATNRQGLAVALLELNRPEQALAELERSLEIHETYDALNARALVLLQLKRYEEAVRTAKKLIAAFPSDPRGYEQLAMAYERQHRLGDAEAILRSARLKVPYRRARFSDQLAIVLRNQGRKAEALAELEAARFDSETDFSPGSRMVLFHLGMLYLELNRVTEGRDALSRFLELTEGAGEPTIVDARRRAIMTLKSRR